MGLLQRDVREEIITMRVLTFEENESFVIGDEVTVTVLRITDDEVELKIERLDDERYSEIVSLAVQRDALTAAGLSRVPR